jgi:hypothetical protein
MGRTTRWRSAAPTAGRKPWVKGEGAASPLVFNIALRCVMAADGDQGLGVRVPTYPGPAYRG